MTNLGIFQLGNTGKDVACTLILEDSSIAEGSIWVVSKVGIYQG